MTDKITFTGELSEFHPGDAGPNSFTMIFEGIGYDNNSIIDKVLTDHIAARGRVRVTIEAVDTEDASP